MNPQLRLSKKNFKIVTKARAERNRRLSRAFHDEHLNEFVPEYKQRLKAITGFTGSAGTALFCRVGKHQLFVDSRYHLQAGQEVSEKWFDVQKSGLEGVPTVEQWLARTGKAAGVVESGF